MQYRDLEIWQQDIYDKDLWHGENGLIVNTSALKDREDFIDVFVSYPEADSLVNITNQHHPPKVAFNIIQKDEDSKRKLG